MTTKIYAAIPVEKVWVSAGSYTYRTEQMECEVVRYLRRACGSVGAARRRFYYEAEVVRPDRVPADYPQVGTPGLFRVNVVRAINPKWKPPEFSAGASVVEVSG